MPLPAEQLAASLRTLRISQVTALAKSIESAIRLRNNDYFAGADLGEVNAKGYTTGQNIAGGVNTGRKRNRDALLKHFKEAAPHLKAHPGLLRQTVNALARFQVDWLELQRSIPPTPPAPPKPGKRESSFFQGLTDDERAYADLFLLGGKGLVFSHTEPAD